MDNVQLWSVFPSTAWWLSTVSSVYQSVTLRYTNKPLEHTPMLLGESDPLCRFCLLGQETTWDKDVWGLQVSSWLKLPEQKFTVTEKHLCCEVSKRLGHVPLWMRIRIVQSCGKPLWSVSLCLPMWKIHKHFTTIHKDTPQIAGNQQMNCGYLFGCDSHPIISHLPNGKIQPWTKGLNGGIFNKGI